MKIAILGTGVVGQTLSEKLISLGHQVFMGTRDAAKSLAAGEPDRYGRPPLSEWVKKNPDAKVVTFEEAARNGELIINATNGMGSLDALKAAGNKNLDGKILIEVSNPLDFSRGMPPSLFVCNTDSMAETIQRVFPQARVVKALNTMTAMVMTNPASVPGNHNVFVAGNDQKAKSEVMDVLKSFGWKNEQIIDTGDITTARGHEMLLPLWVMLMGKFQNPMFNWHIAK